MKRTLVAILLSLFTILTLISIWMLYYTHQIPINEKTVTRLYTYGHYGTFSCIAALKPNIIYNNNTSLDLSGGSVFRRVTDKIDVGFTYEFVGSRPANLTVHCMASEFVETPKWQKQIAQTQEKTLDAAGSDIALYINDIPPVNLSSVQELTNKISQETGISAAQPIVTVTVQMTVEADTPEGLIIESFTPILTVRFASGFSEGDTVSTEGTYYEKTGEITDTQTTYQPWVETQRYVSYALSIVSFPGLLASICAYVNSSQAKPIMPEALIKEAIDPFKEIISEAAEEPQLKDNPSFSTTTIPMKTLEDLMKVADILGKPIIRTRKPPETHTFYVIDSTTRYEYTMTESSLIERMKRHSRP